jgi:signal transduction histidine kinase
LAPIGTNVSPRVKYGWIPSTNGTVIGWARLGDGSVIGYNARGFVYQDRLTYYLFGLGAVVMILFCIILFSNSWRLVGTARRAREVVKIKESFLDTMSHELNTPLASIVPLASALAEGGFKEARHQAEALETVRRESMRMARMIDELLTTVRLRNGKLTFARGRVDLGAVVEEAADLVRRRYPDGVIRISGEGPVFACADRDKVEQVVINLLENACKYAGEAMIEVSFRPGAKGHVEVEVADRGPGLPSGPQERLFERFYRGASGEASPLQGLGLGLAIVAGFVRGMGGAVEARNRAGGGSVFKVTLPGGEASGEEGTHG